MKSSTIFKTIFFKITARISPSPVAPWPIRGEFDRWLGLELDNLHPGDHRVEPCTSATWVLRALDMVEATQRKTMESVSANTFRGAIDRKWIDDYLNNAVELLDTCNSLRERMATVMKYTESVSLALHSLGGGRVLTESALSRARVALSSCESMERRWSELDRCGSNLKRLGEKLAQSVNLGACGVARPCSSKVTQCNTELQEALSASKSVTLLVCGLLSISLSFRSRGGLLATQLTQSRKAESWSSSLQELQKLVKEEVEKQRKSGGPVLDELRSTVAMVQDLRGLIQRQGDEVSRSELRGRVESLGRSCGVLEEGIRMFEGRVNELYKHLISIRMALLGVFTMA